MKKVDFRLEWLASLASQRQNRNTAINNQETKFCSEKIMNSCAILSLVNVFPLRQHKILLFVISTKFQYDLISFICHLRMISMNCLCKTPLDDLARENLLDFQLLIIEDFNLIRIDGRRPPALAKGMKHLEFHPICCSDFASVLNSYMALICC